jgi:hypothetical protein
MTTLLKAVIHLKRQPFRPAFQPGSLPFLQDFTTMLKSPVFTGV